jgi:homoserine O-succinyltransferase
MALLIDGGRIPPRWAEKKNVASARSREIRRSESTEWVRIALVNNMPDPALEDTEMQFMELLESAAGDLPVRLKLYSLPRVPRGDRGLEHLSDFYSGVDELWSSNCDALIMTGTEPRQADLRQEPYWHALTDVLDWAERNTTSTVLSCLAAHASVQHSDGVSREPLADKQFGVFESSVVREHELTASMPRTIRFPHSRWNEVREEALVSCGYSVLTRSSRAGVDLFVKQKRESLFVHFQGHPEYEAHTLLKEYRRDIKRFLRQERETYPNLPFGYFDAAAAGLLADYKQTALARPREEQLLFFPEAAVVESLQNSWRSSATGVYRNWLRYVLAKKNEKSAFVSAPRSTRGASTTAAHS